MEEKILEIKNLMTNLRNWNDWDFKNYQLTKEEAEIVVDSLMLQLPLDVEVVVHKEQGTDDDYRCPNEDCSMIFPRIAYNSTRCKFCGQLLNWKEVAE